VTDLDPLCVLKISSFDFKADFLLKSLFHLKSSQTHYLR